MPFDESPHDWNGGGDDPFHDFEAMHGSALAGIQSMSASAVINDVCVWCTGLHMIDCMAGAAFTRWERAEPDSKRERQFDCHDLADALEGIAAQLREKVPAPEEED